MTEEGWEYEADQRHADLIIQETGAERLSTLTHPGGDKKVMEEEEKSKELVGAEATRFHSGPIDICIYIYIYIYISHQPLASGGLGVVQSK